MILQVTVHSSCKRPTRTDRPGVKDVPLLPHCGELTVLHHHLSDFFLTFYRQSEALLDGNPQGLVGDAADELTLTKVPQRSLEVEESRHGVRHVLGVVFVARQQDVHLFRQGSADPLAWSRWLLFMPNYFHIQWVISHRLTHNLLLLTLLQEEIRLNVYGDTGRLWGKENENVQAATSALLRNMFLFSFWTVNYFMLSLISKKKKVF